MPLDADTRRRPIMTGIAVIILSQRLNPATLALGAFTFTMTALPGTPAIQNAIPMPHFGTTRFAAPGLGMIGGATMLMLVVLIGSTFGSFQQSAGGRDAAQREIFRSIDSTTPARKVMMVKVCGSRKCGK